MQKFTIQAIGAALVLCFAGGVSAAVVPATHDATMLHGLGNPIGAGSSFALSTPSADSRSSASRSSAARAEPGANIVAASTTADTLGMLVAGMAVMAIVVRRRWNTDR